MQTPLQLTFRNMAHSPALAAHIERRVDRLELICNRVTSCHVIVELYGHHPGHCGRCRFSIHLGLPGHSLVVSHHAHDEYGPESAVAKADAAFEEAERQLEDWVRRQRGRRHEEARGSL
jgi:putative sigma-54 modulation protein